MKKMIAFLISTVIPVIIPICAIVSLPVCVAEKYLPQDVKNSIQYGVRFFHLVWAANDDSKQQPIAQQELTPYVESTVTSMTLASLDPEPACEFTQKAQYAPRVLEVNSFPTPMDQLQTKIDVIVERAVKDNAVSKIELRKLNDLKFDLQQELMNAALENAMHRVDIINELKHLQKKTQKPVRIVVKPRPLSPA